jgi:hypothetical protein
MEAKRKLVFSPRKFEKMKKKVEKGASIRQTAAEFGMNECTFRKHLKVAEVSYC